MPGPFDQDASFQPLPRAALTAMRLEALVGAVALAVPTSVVAGLITVARGELGFGTWLVLVACWVLLLLGGGFVFAGARWRRVSWRLDDDGLVIRRGVFWRSETLVPRSRVQHVDLSHGPLDRWLGLAALKVHTAGTRLAAVTLAGLEQATAEALRDVLVDEDTAAGDSTTPAPFAGAGHGG